MPRYYFHVRRGQITVLDHGGIELSDNAGAEAEGAQRAQGLVNGASVGEASASRGRIIVADDNWQTLFEFPWTRKVVLGD
jgi:hypothetical protein